MKSWPIAWLIGLIRVLLGWWNLGLIGLGVGVEIRLRIWVPSRLWIDNVSWDLLTRWGIEGLIVREVRLVDWLIVESVVIIDHLCLSSLSCLNNHHDHTNNTYEKEQGSHKCNGPSWEARWSVIIRVVWTVWISQKISITVYSTEICGWSINGCDYVGVVSNGLFKVSSWGMNIKVWWWIRIG